ncbi:T9SS type A sorting domain-containing protein [bacterium]|nr:T9SS type A sorting domain-containing protein [bacterium]
MRRLLFVLLMTIFIVGVWGQGMPHMLTGTVERFEGGYPADGCLYFQIFKYDSGDTLEITDTDYDHETGVWTATITVNDGIVREGDSVRVIVTDSCYAEEAIYIGQISGSFITDLGTETMNPIPGIRPEFGSLNVSPDTGYIEDNYNFGVVYYNGRNNAPASIFVTVDGTDYALSADSLLDTDYTDGAAYSTDIAGATLGFRNHTYTYFVHATDAVGRPGWSDTLEFTILNHPPVLDSAWLSVTPEPPQENSVITCEIGAVTDSEDDPVEITYEWFVNGDTVEGLTGNTIDGTYFNKHDIVWCVVYTYDGYDYGENVETEHIEIQNTVPTMPEVGIFPEVPFDFENIAVIISTPSTDDDDDVIEYQYEWQLDGMSVSSEEILDNLLTTTGQTGMLIVFSFDGEDYGPSDTVNFIIGGPVLSDGEVAPTEAHASESFVFTVVYTNARDYPPAEIYVDIDGDLYPMAASDPEDTDYTDGATFVYSKNLSVVSHQFRFSAVDDHGDVAIGMSDYIDGPIVLNFLPVVDETSILPSPEAMMSDDIIASCTAWHDDDGDAVSFTYQWYCNGEIVEGLTSQVVAGTNFARDDTVYCEITPFDSYEYGVPVATDAIVIINTPPYAPEVGIEPEIPFSFEDVSAQIIIPSVDLDSDDVTYSYAWFREGYLVDEGEILSADWTSTGQDWMLAVLAYDGFDYGDTVWFDFTIDGPELTGGYVDPATGGPMQIFNYYVTYTNSRNYSPEYVRIDVDGTIYNMTQFDIDDVDYTDGAIFVYSTTLEYGIEHQYRFFAEDDHGDPATGMGDYIAGPVITNNPPVIDSVAVSPYPEGTVLDNYIASVISWHDDDGDAVSFTYRWYRNGEIVDGATEPTISGDNFVRGDEVWCEITAYDGYDYGTPVSTPIVEIINCAPVVEGAYIDVTPAGAPTELSTLTARTTTLYDPDDDIVVLSYKWFVNGELLDLGTYIGAINGEYFDRGDTVYAEIEVSDGELITTVITDEVIIENALPVVTDFGIEPAFPYTTDDLVVSLDYYEPDSDAVTVEYMWRSDGVLISTENNVPSDMTRHYETWSLEVRLTDGLDPEEYTVMYDTVEILNSPPELVDEFLDTIAICGLDYHGHIPVIDADFDYLTFELTDGPDGLVVHGDGSLEWLDVPDVDLPESYEVTITISDGDDDYILTFNLWVYPLTDELFSPTHLEAMSGYTGLIPLHWDIPMAFGVLPYMPSTFVGYEIYRSTTPDSTGWELLTTTSVNSAIDTDVEPYTVYYYYVIAIYEDGPSSPSNIDYAFSSPGEITDWYSSYLYDTAPEIDGIIETGEWDNAMTYTYTVDSLECKLMFMHKNNYLYIAFVNTADNTLSLDDMFMVNIDDNYDDRWPSETPSGEGEYRIKKLTDGAEVTYQGIWGTFPSSIGRDVRTAILGLDGAVSDEDGNVTYELAIPIGADYGYLTLPEFDTWVGTRIAVYDVDDLDWDLILPSTSDPENPDEFGELYIESGEPSGMLCYHPGGFDVTLRQDGTTTRLLNIGNCGMGYLNYDISEACALTPAGSGGLMRVLDGGAIVAYVDDYSLIPQALTILGYPASTYTDADDFLSAVAAGSWDLVIVSANDVSNYSIWNAVLIALDSGAKLLIQSPDLDAIEGYSIWDYMGLGLGTDLGDRGSALNWELPEHPFFNVPFDVPPSIERIEGEFTDYGDNLIPSEDYSVLATFDLYPYPNNAALVYSEERGIIINSFMLSNINDTDGDSIIDGVELLVNEIGGLLPCEDVAWLSESPISGLLMARESQDVTVVFDATGLAVGEYYAFLMIHTNDFGHPMAYVPCHLTVTEPEPRPLQLTVNAENYGCPDNEILVPIYANSLDMMNITNLGMTVSVDPSVGQPIDVDAIMGDVSSLSFGAGSVTFSVSNDFPFPGDGPIAVIHIEIDHDATVGTRTSVTLSDIFYNEDAYVTETTLFPGNLYIVSCADDWSVTLDFQAFGVRPDDVIIGANPDATDSYDDGIDVINTPTGSFLDAYSDISVFDPEHPQLSTDYRNGYELEIHWFIETGDSAGKVEWVFADGVPLSSMGSLLLYCGDDIVDMKTAAVYYYNAGENIEIVYRATGERMFDFDFSAGYNMFSMPLYTDDTDLNDLFPGNLGAWRFDSDLDTWIGVTSIEPGVGYIILFLEPADFTVWGVPVDELTLDITSGWNLIGTIMNNIDFSAPDDDPDGSILGSPGHSWWYDQSVEAYINMDQLEGGKGYFVASLNPCTLNLPGSDGMGRVEPAKEPIWFGKITSDNFELRFGMGDVKMTPIPPTFPNSQQKLGYFVDGDWNLSTFINKSGEWNLNILKDATVGFELPTGISIDVDGVPATGDMNLTVGLHKLVAHSLPIAFALKQNVPNPFNSSTIFDYAVPEKSQVNITVYDMAGHLVKTLISGEVAPGFYQAVWTGIADDGRAVGSGVYLCRMKAGNFSSVRRMILVK